MASSKRRPNYDRFPVSFAKRQLRQKPIREWDERYKSGTVAGTTKIFFPDVTAAYSVIRKFEPSCLSTQLLTGHGGFSEYICRFKCKKNPSCICDPAVDETVPHIILECPVYAVERYEIEQLLSLKLTKESIGHVMKSKKRVEFLNYCLKIIEPVVKRNK